MCQYTQNTLQFKCYQNIDQTFPNFLMPGPKKLLAYGQGHPFVICLKPGPFMESTEK